MSGPYLRGPERPLRAVTLGEQDLFADLETTYGGVARICAAHPDLWGGWKLGGSNHGSRAAFGVSELYYGALTHDEILSTPAMAPGFALLECKGEVEIALRLGPDGVQPDAWAVALEMPASAITNLMERGVRALVADRCAAGALLLGPQSPLPLPPRLEQSLFVLEADGVVLDRADLSALVAPPETLLAGFLALARGHGISIAPGAWIATGGITRCMDLVPGTRVRVSLDDTVHLDLRLSMGAAE